MKNIAKYLLVLGVFALILAPSASFAETDDTTDPETEEVVEETTEVEDSEDVVEGEVESEDLEDDDYEDLDLEETPTEPPSNFGLWFRNVREQLSLTFTFDAAKKAEKHVKFAEERMALAELMSSSSVPEVRARAEAMVAKATKFMENVEKNRERWEKVKDNKHVQKILRNAATFELRSEQRLDRIEAGLPVEELERFQELRDASVARGKRLLNAINNENVPERVREHLQSIKDQIEVRAEERDVLKTRKATLMEEAKAGGAEARERLQNFYRDLKAKSAERREDVKERKAEVQELKAEAREGDEEAKAKLEQIKEKGAEVRANLKEKAQQIRAKVQERKEVLKDKAVDGNPAAKQKLKEIKKVEKKVMQPKKPLPKKKDY